MNTITTRPLTSQDSSIAKKGLELLNRTQGVGLFESSWLEERLDTLGSLVIAAFREYELVGIAAARIIDRFDYYLPFDSAIARDLQGRHVISFETASVLESLQGRGIGRLLMQKRMEWAVQQKAEIGLGVSWVSGLAHTSQGTFEWAGFRAVKRVEDFYLKSSEEKPFDCPGCRLSPCRCAAILYRRDFLAAPVA